MSQKNGDRSVLTVGQVNALLDDLRAARKRSHTKSKRLREMKAREVEQGRAYEAMRAQRDWLANQLSIEGDTTPDEWLGAARMWTGNRRTRNGDPILNG